MNSFLRDFRHGARLCRRAPGFTAIAVLALALGIGSTTSIFSVVDAALLRPLPFRDPDQLLVVWERNPAKTPFRMFVSPSNFFDWRAQARSFSSMSAVQAAKLNLSGGPRTAEPEEIEVERVSANLLSVLGVSPALGTAFLPEEDKPGRAVSVLLSHRLWNRRFGADRNAVGKSVRLRDASYTIAGVMPPGFAIVNPRVDAWIPLPLNPGDPRGAIARNLMVVARLAPSATLAQATAEMEAIGAGLERDRPEANSGWRPWLWEMREEIAGGVRRALLVLLAAVTLLLLVACANVANLLLSRAAGRQKEIAIRAALGAGRSRIVVQLLAENLLLSLAGGSAGLALAAIGIRALARLAPVSLQRLATVSIDYRLLLFALACSLATSLIFGLAPALAASRSDLSEALKDSSRGSTGGRRRQYLRDALVIGEIGIAVVVLVGAGLLVRSFLRLRATDPGFPSEHLLTMRIPLAGGRNASEAKRISFFQEVVQRAGAVPGVRSAGAVTALPLAGLGGGSAFTVDGRPPLYSGDSPICLVRPATPGYLSTLGVQLRAGRAFTPADLADAPRVAIVNATLVRRALGDRNPLGARLTLESPRTTVEIVGVAGDTKSDRLERPDWPTVYLPYPQAPAYTMVLLARTTGEPAAVAPAITREIRRLDPDQPVADVRSMEQLLDESVAAARFNAVVLSIFAGVAFLLAAVGIYGVTAYGVRERTQEFGIRLALGAEPRRVLAQVLRRTGVLAAIGIAIGLAAAWGLTHLMAALLYTTDPRDLGTFAAIALSLGAVALAAGYLPARRAVQVNPVAALRAE
jgi:putative ABC transport system permease protein